MSTNPRDVVARIEARIAGYEALLAKRPDCWPGDEFGKGGGAEYVSDLRTILSALQPAVSEEAVEVALRALMSARGEMLSTPKAEMFRDAIAAPNSQVWSYLLRAAITAALPFMMGERT